MREAHCVELVTTRCPQIVLEKLGKVHAFVGGIVVIPHIGEIDQHLLTTGEIDKRAIGIAERVERQFSSHFGLPFLFESPLSAVRITSLRLFQISTDKSRSMKLINGDQKN